MKRESDLAMTEERDPLTNEEQLSLEKASADELYVRRNQPDTDAMTSFSATHAMSSLDDATLAFKYSRTNSLDRSNLRTEVSSNIARSKQLISELKRTKASSARTIQRVRVLYDSQKLIESSRRLHERFRNAEAEIFRNPVIKPGKKR